MSLPDYYQILQVSTTATSIEIKTAYRRLAKIYHPDKNYGNPVAEEKFKQIKEAYEILINTVRRRKYDEKRNRSVTSSATTSEKKSSVKKNYSFSEEEAKRRQYYQQHYKTKSKVKYQESKKEKTGLTEIKYILISVPIAVALLLLMIRLYEKPKNEKIKNNISIDSVAKNKSEISTPEIPYESVFGKSKYDTTSHSIIKLINKSGYDAIVFLQNDSHKIIRHHFIENNYQLFLENIPVEKYKIYYWLGKHFSYTNFLFGNIMGNFKESVLVDSSDKQITIQSNKKDTFLLSIESVNNPKNDTVLLKNIFGRKK